MPNGSLAWRSAIRSRPPASFPIVRRSQPRAIVCLGATAAQALLGKTFTVTQDRGELVQSPLALIVPATVHPSALLRAPGDETRRRETTRFIGDLRKVARSLKIQS